MPIDSIVPTSNPILFGHVKNIEKVCPASRSSALATRETQFHAHATTYVL